MTKLFKNILATMLGLLVTLLPLEFALRIYVRLFPAKAANLVVQPHPHGGNGLVASDGQSLIVPGGFLYISHPYLYFKSLPDQHDALFNVNALGLRGAEVAREKKPGVFRVVATGGSTAFGLGASTDNQVWTRALEAKLSTCPSFRGKVEVLNAGVISFIAKQELLYLQLELLDLSPDLVVTLNGYNDWMEPSWRTSGCTEPIPSYFNTAGVFLEEHLTEKDQPILSQIGGLLAAVAWKTYFGKFVFIRIASLRNSATATLFNAGPERAYADSAKEPNGNEPDIYKDCVPTLTGNYKRTLQKMARLLQGRNIPFLIALQPLLANKKDLSQEEKGIDLEMKKEWPLFQHAAAHTYPHMAKAAAAVAAENPLTRFLDLTTVFDNHPEPAFSDSTHLNDRGHEIVAQAIYDYICRHKDHWGK